MHGRAYIKRYGKGLSGPKKFTLLLSYMTQGKTDIEIRGAEIEKKWNSMTSKELMGMKYNGAFATRAKENGWANSPKNMFYVLGTKWTNIFK